MFSQLFPTQVAEILKDRSSWFRDCRAVDVLNVLSTGNGGTIELLYMQVSVKRHYFLLLLPGGRLLFTVSLSLGIQLYAPTTLAPARDFWLLRYTSAMEDGSLVVFTFTHIYTELSEK